VIYPSWDLSFVLNSLGSHPFEPLVEIELRLLTYKTLFLLLFATGCRRGEIHAIDYQKISHTERWKSITLYPLLEFVSKTQLSSKGASALQPITIPSLAHDLGSDLLVERVLCPVRCLKVYLARTSHLRTGKRRLFISYQLGRSTDISKSTLSGWIKKLLQLVYLNADKDASRLYGRLTHEIRSLSSSFAFQGQVALEDIMSACSWKNHNTFTDFYLKDVLCCNDMLKLGPLVAAQRVVAV